MKLNNKITALIAALLLSVTVSAQIPLDKQKHFAAGCLAGATFTAFTMNKPISESLIFTTSMTTAVGITKEITDASTTGFSWADIAYTAAGGLISWTAMRAIPEAVFTAYGYDMGPNSYVCVAMKMPIYKNQKGKIKRRYKRKVRK